MNTVLTGAPKTVHRSEPHKSTGEPFFKSENSQGGFFSSAFTPTVQKRNSGLPELLQTKLESSFGQDFSGVGIHKNSSQAPQLGALAFTQGEQIHFAPGQFNPDTQTGQKLIGHEFTHVVQQRSGTVQPSRVLRKGTQLNDDTSLEAEADELGSKAVAGEKITKYQTQAAVAPENTSVIQRITQPIEAKAPASAINLVDFIVLVEQEEQKYPITEQTNTSLMITRIRKIFYGSKGWDDNLIRGVSHIQSPYGTPLERERSRKSVEVPGPLNDFDMVDTETYPVNSQGVRPDIYKNQEVRLPDGNFIDMGHVFAGLDAHNHRHAASAPIFSSISIDNLSGTTWVGDLGSALAEAQIKYVNDGSLSESQYQTIINEYASPQDMLGNIDAYVIADSYTIASAAGQKVSQILRHYYLGEGQTQHQANRYLTFATMLGLQNWNGDTWTNLNDRIDFFADEVNDAAALYIAAGSRSWNPIGWGGATAGMSMNDGSTNLVKAFFTALKQRIKANTK